jgi:hypothetical protein
MLNVSRDDLHKIQFTKPEELLQAVAEIKRDAAFIINNYALNGETTPGQDKANIQIALIEKNFGNYADKLTTSYISEPDFDRPAPLTTVEERTVEKLFAGCESSYSKRERASELVEQGKGDLISRSEYVKYLPGGWNAALELSPMGEMLLNGSIQPDQYAGFSEVYHVVKPDETVDLSVITGVGAPEGENAVQDNAE